MPSGYGTLGVRVSLAALKDTAFPGFVSVQRLSRRLGKSAASMHLGHLVPGLWQSRSLRERACFF